MASAATLFPYSVAKLGRVVPAVPLWIYLVIVAAALVVTFAATLPPTWRATRFRPVEAATAAACPTPRSWCSGVSSLARRWTGPIGRSKVINPEPEAPGSS
ncbi:hypothetical protein [Microtetraspora niveoalba]|uniref:hypothetical protein n=1 Tax=Microtetraspora niveoalba TaxID=46175 RepID=UPI0012FCA455|nr:hypothetical protein [Microtetraspora niveoalba]